MDVERQTAKLGARTLADKVRLKEPDSRTAEERRYVAIDLIQNPHLYEHMSATEAEEMQFDPLYQCELTKSDLDRIERLPEQVSLALPFLYTMKEIEVHKLINKYRKGMDEEFFRRKDLESEGDENTRSNNENKPNKEDEIKHNGSDVVRIKVTPEDMNNAEVVHDKLVKVRGIC